MLRSVPAVLQLGEIDGLVVVCDGGGMHVRYAGRHIRQLWSLQQTSTIVGRLEVSSRADSSQAAWLVNEQVRS